MIDIPLDGNNDKEDTKKRTKEIKVKIARKHYFM
jgi:hypothetical protein